jgi:gamma-D-glutamyl-L-lysine dipeptidyl-peptidase
MQKESSSEWPLIDAYGICRQTVLPLYRQPTFDSALVTQLLFGECYQINGLTSDRQWFRVYHEDTGMGGWVWAKLIKEITGEEYQKFLNQDFQVVTSPIAAIEYLGANLYLLPGSRLHFSELELFNWQDHIGFTGSYRPHASKASRDELVEIALRYLNAPFQAGGRSIFGLDEEQAFALIYSIAGYAWKSGRIPGKSVPPEEAQPGDLFVFRDLEKQESHFGLFLGTEEILWMDNRMRVSDLGEWEDFLGNITEQEVVFDTRSVVN